MGGLGRGAALSSRQTEMGGSRDEFIHHVISLSRWSDGECECGRSLPRWFGSVSTACRGSGELVFLCELPPHPHVLVTASGTPSCPRPPQVTYREREEPLARRTSGLLMVSAQLCPLSTCHRRVSPGSGAHAGQRSRSPTHVMNHPQT